MDAIEFRNRAVADPALAAMLGDVAADAGTQVQVDRPESFTLAGGEVLLAVAAYALFRAVKGLLDHQRAVEDLALLVEQKELVEELVAAGFPPDVARATVESLAKEISKRGVDDPVLKKALDLVTGVA